VAGAGLTPWNPADTLFFSENLKPTMRNSVSTPIGNPSADRAVSGTELIARLPKVWIGYVLAFATLIGEMIAVARHPELVKGAEITIPPLEIYLPAFVGLVYWLVCIHRYHVVLAHVPGWKHPISPGRAVWFHFIPIFVIYWVFRWPAAIASFVNQRLGAKVMNGWTVAACFFASLLCRLFVDAALHVTLLFFACTYISAFLQRALAAPEVSQA
jgi:hypothetical protein